MSSFRKKTSGAENRKKKAKESAERDYLLKKIPKISTFMTTTSSNESNSNENEVQSPCLSVVLEETVQQDTQEIQSDSPSINLLSSDLTRSKDYTISTDPYLWELNELTRDFIAVNGTPQNINADFKNSRNIYSDKTRFCSTKLFKRIMKNGEVQPRGWLIYSETKGSVFCAPCLLFGDNNETNAFTGEGFCDWKNSKARVEGHENSSFHKTCVSQLKTRGTARGRVDQFLAQQLEEEISYWKKILQRVVAIVKSLSMRGLPFRGHSEQLGNPHNGNFLGTVELLAEFDPFLADHLKLFAHRGSDSTSYLSKTIYEEIILLIYDQVLKQISTEVRNAKYFGIIVDSTPDIAHVDQLTIILRYVLNTGEIVERFLGFVPNAGHKAKDIENAILNVLSQNDLDVMNCRGQSYDNASNMSGIYSGVQARIKTLNPLAEYAPCAAHSLNLVGTCAAESVPEAVDFFSTVQELYNFFTISTHRWEILILRANQSLKTLSKTRWSARHDACYALEKEWSGILDALNFIATSTVEKPNTRSEAIGLQKKLRRLETAILVIVWNTILERFNAVSKKLQQSQIDLSTVVELYDSLASFLQDMRNKQFFHYEEKAKSLSGVETYYAHDTRRKKIRKLQSDESRVSEREPYSGHENFRTNIYYRILDILSVELTKRKGVYKQLHDNFSFFDNLPDININKLTELTVKTVAKYSNDLEEALSNECIHLQCYLKQLLGKVEDTRSASNIRAFLHSRELYDIYPNIDIALRIYLSIPATNCSGERSFSTLKRVKSYLRASMKQNKLNALALLTIEAQLVQEIKYEEVIDIFARTKARKKNY